MAGRRPLPDIEILSITDEADAEPPRSRRPLRPVPVLAVLLGVLAVGAVGGLLFDGSDGGGGSGEGQARAGRVFAMSNGGGLLLVDPTSTEVEVVDPQARIDQFVELSPSDFVIRAGDKVLRWAVPGRPGMVGLAQSIFAATATDGFWMVGHDARNRYAVLVRDGEENHALALPAGQTPVAALDDSLVLVASNGRGRAGGAIDIWRRTGMTRVAEAGHFITAGSSRVAWTSCSGCPLMVASSARHVQKIQAPAGFRLWGPGSFSITGRYVAAHAISATDRGGLYSVVIADLALNRATIAPGLSSIGSMTLHWTADDSLFVLDHDGQLSRYRPGDVGADSLGRWN